jgi:hypothetical protein
VFLFQGDTNIKYDYVASSKIYFVMVIVLYKYKTSQCTITIYISVDMWAGWLWSCVHITITLFIFYSSNFFSLLLGYNKTVSVYNLSEHLTSRASFTLILGSGYTHCWKWNWHACRTAKKDMFLYFNLCHSVMLNRSY